MSDEHGDTHYPANGAASLYVNYFEVAHNRYEFLVEFGQYRPGKDDVAGTVGIHTRLALSPPYAKMLSDLLSRAISEHEKGHGAIATIAAASTPFDIVLQALPEFEERARQLRAQARDNPALRPQSDASLHIKTGDAS
jgi:Protein of unknown function (DUF3467)